jgi:hypothetical protein
MSGRGTVEQEPEFVAWVGIDWADQKHVWCLQAANSARRENGELEHKPEVVEAWVSELEPSVKNSYVKGWTRIGSKTKKRQRA